MIQNEGCELIGQDEDNLYYVTDSGDTINVPKIQEVNGWALCPIHGVYPTWEGSAGCPECIDEDES